MINFQKTNCSFKIFAVPPDFLISVASFINSSNFSDSQMENCIILASIFCNSLQVLTLTVPSSLGRSKTKTNSFISITLYCNTCYIDKSFSVSSDINHAVQFFFLIKISLNQSSCSPIIFPSCSKCSKGTNFSITLSFFHSLTICVNSILSL